MGTPQLCLIGHYDIIEVFFVDSFLVLPVPDEESFLDQTLLGLFWALFFNEALAFGLLCWSLHCPVCSKNHKSFNQSPSPSISGHPWYLLKFLFPPHAPVGVWWPLPAFSKNPGRFLLLGQNPLLPWCFVLIMFYPRTQPPSHPLTINSHFSLLCCSWALDAPDTNFCPANLVLRGRAQLPIASVGCSRAS